MSAISLPNGYSSETIARAFNPRQLQLILLPTEKCNFRCTYCYESFALGKMPIHVIEGILGLIDKRVASLDFLDISWFGGEPLLEKSIVFHILNHAHRVCAAHSVAFNSGFTTNGYLITPELVSELSALNSAAFQITLDGEKETHDQSRRLANGRGTFDVIWGNLLRLRASTLNFKITLRIHISSRNHLTIADFVKQVNFEFGGDPRFSIHFHRVTDLGGETKTENSFLTESTYRLALAKAVGTASLQSDSEVHLNEAREICYAAKPNSLLVRANGRLGKCTVAFEDPRNDIGFIRPDGSLEIDNSKLHLWMDGFTDLNPPSLSCPLSTLGRQVRTLPVNVEVVS